MLKVKMISVMKLTKDTMENPLPIVEINKILATLKSTGATHIEIATVIGHPNFKQISKLWADAIHAKDLSVTWRCAHINMEGLYGRERFVGGNRRPVEFWIDEAKKAAQDLVEVNAITDNDEWAIYPERTEGIWQDNTSWFWPNTPNNYANAFIMIHEACKTVFPNGVSVGLSANNGSELLSGWIDKKLVDYAGAVVVDHYRDNNITLYETEIRDMAGRYNVPVYVQEGSPSRFNFPSREEADAYYNVNKKLADEGILVGYGSWSGWTGTNESILIKDPAGKYILNVNGLSLQAWWGGQSEPEPDPDPEPTPDPDPEPDPEPTPDPDPEPEPEPEPTPAKDKIIQITIGNLVTQRGNDLYALTKKGNIWWKKKNTWKKLKLPKL